MPSPQKPPYAAPGLDSFRRTDRLARLQRAATWLAPLLALSWVAGTYAVGRTQRYSPGPLASAHALWNDRCDACHTTSQPISAGNWLGWITGATHAGDAACSKCHQGPPHHPAQKPEEVAACTACHAEHRGQQSSLVRVANEHCTHCHRDLTKHADPSPKGLPVAKVTAFDGDLDHHPPFMPVDTGRLKFNHKLHMLRGLSRPGDKAGFLLQDIPKALRAQFNPLGASDQTPVLLRCATCHQLDAGRSLLADAERPRVPAQAAHPDRPAGAYMLPISYEVHCQACHPLTVGHQDYVFLQVPHRLALADVHAYLEGFYAPRYLKKQAELKEKEQPRPLPGRPPPRNPLEALAEAIKNPVTRAEQELYETRKGCVLCHDLAPDPLAKSPTGAPAAREVVSTNVPTVWLRKASFNHTTHRLLECRACHPRADAYTNGAQDTLNPHASERSSDALLPAIDNCFACHASVRQPKARSDCVECHRYHNGEFPLEGKGTVRRGPPRAVSLEEFLAGLPRPDR